MVRARYVFVVYDVHVARHQGRVEPSRRRLKEGELFDLSYPLKMVVILFPSQECPLLQSLASNENSFVEKGILRLSLLRKLSLSLTEECVRWVGHSWNILVDHDLVGNSSSLLAR